MEFKIISIDPGLTCLGWAYSLYDTDTNIFEVQKTGVLKASKLASKQKDLVDVYGSRILALQEVEQHISKLLKTYNPDFVASEDAFFYPKSPNAYGALLMVIHTIERVLYFEHEVNHLSKDSARVLYKYAPRNIKNISSGNSLSFKSNMKEALIANEHIKFKVKDSENVSDLIAGLTEHEVDAIQCGFTFIQISLPGILY